MIDPTINDYTMQTNHKGDFQKILNLTSFEIISIEDIELKFIEEVSQFLKNGSIQFYEEEKKSLKADNILSIIEMHEKCPSLYSNFLENEIDFAASHLYEMKSDYKNELLKLSKETIEKILNNPNIILKSENQLLSIINKLYLQNSEEFAFLYEYVIFTNISTVKMKNFFNIFDFNDMTGGLWNRICERMEKEIKDQYLYINAERYKRKFTKHLDLINNKKFKLNSVVIPPPPPPPPPPPGNSFNRTNRNLFDDDESTSETW